MPTLDHPSLPHIKSDFASGKTLFATEFRGETTLVVGKDDLHSLLAFLKTDERCAYDFLSDTHGGWENNDGAYGEFCFDASARTVHLEFNERFTSSELYTHDF